MQQQQPPKNKEAELFDRRQALVRYGAMALGGVLGSILLSGCRAPEVYRPIPDVEGGQQGPVTGYLVDPRFCTRCGDCFRVCRCDAVGGFTYDADNKKKSPAKTAEEADPDQCWIYIDLCCACGRCYQVCDVDAIVPTYGPRKVPRRNIREWKAGMAYGFKKSKGATTEHCCQLNDPPAGDTAEDDGK